MLRRILGASALVGVLFVAPITLDQSDTSQLPTVTLNDAACAEQAKCCFEVKSICIDGDESVINYRPAEGSSCRR